MFTTHSERFYTDSISQITKLTCSRNIVPKKQTLFKRPGKFKSCKLIQYVSLKCVHARVLQSLMTYMYKVKVSVDKLKE